MQPEYSDILSRQSSMMSENLKSVVNPTKNQLDVTIACTETSTELLLPVLNFSVSRTGCELQLEISHQNMKKIQDSFLNTCTVKCLNYSKKSSLHKYKIEKTLTDMLLVTLEFTDY